MSNNTPNQISILLEKLGGVIKINKVCSKDCWNYADCLKRDTEGMIACFKKNESLCHYCKKELNCKVAGNSCFICTMYEKR
jgi:hypothetical protein